MGANFASFPIGTTSLSDSGEEAPYQAYLEDGGVPQYYTAAELYISFSGIVYLQSATQAGTIAFSTPSLSGNVGTDEGDYDSLVGTLSLDDDADSLGENGLTLRLNYKDSTPGDVFSTAGLYTSADLPAFPEGDAITGRGSPETGHLEFWGRRDHERRPAH